MQQNYRLIILEGPDKGAQHEIPAKGGGLGRSSRNAIALGDEQLSRMHCRFHFRQGELWLTDLASANGTFVDGAEITEQKLVPGCKIEVGETTLQLVAEGGSAAVPAPTTHVPLVTINAGGASNVIDVTDEAGIADAAADAAGDSSVDLGLSAGEEQDAATSIRGIRRTLIMSLVSFVVLIGVALGVKLLLDGTGTAPVVTPVWTAEDTGVLEIRYTKLEAGLANIFRYELSLNAAGILAVRIDDLAQQRHVRKESPGPVDARLLDNLNRNLKSSGFFALDSRYEGIAPPNTQTELDLTIVLGSDVHRVQVSNRNEPEEFRKVRERIETFARNDLGLWAFEFSREKLMEMAQEAYLLGEKLLREKDIQAGNLFAAMRSFRECNHFLETVDPKPPFLTDALNQLRKATDELEDKHADLNLLADRAVNLKDWEEAANHLRQIIELIPDPNDERYRDAEARLLDVESRIKSRR